MTTGLPDFLGDGLWAISIGLNPSPMSATMGFPFANPRNRFWPAFNASALASEVYEPGRLAVARIVEVEGIGFTDIVKRTTPGSADLVAADFRLGAPLLADKLRRYRPAVAWFQGLVAYRNYLKFALEERVLAAAPVEWGLQADRGDGCRHFVSPNPSPANAKFSLADLRGWFDRLARLRER